MRDIISKSDSYFITKYDKSLSVFYYKMRQFLQNEMFITEYMGRKT